MPAQDVPVSNAVSSIIAAFASGLDILRELRDRRQRRRRREKSGRARGGGPGRGGRLAGPQVQQVEKNKSNNDNSSSSSSSSSSNNGDDLSLSKSLRRGPEDIRRAYERRYSRAGSLFARGDAAARSCLTETLLKLNTGLVAIISSFLSSSDAADKGDRGRGSSLNLDYKSLTTLSDASRSEAIDALALLYHRLSQFQLVLQPTQTSCARCGSQKHKVCALSTNERVRTGQKVSFERKRRPSAASPAENGPTVARISKASGSQSRLVIIRPRNPRATSSSSSSVDPAAKSQAPSALALDPVHATATLSSDSAPPTLACRPMLDKTPSDPVDGNSRRPKPRKPFAGATPEGWPYENREPTLPVIAPPGHGLNFERNPQTTKPVSPLLTSHLQPPPLPISRRLDKPTPSAYSFASDSTKLGEIPMRNWAVPYDFAAMGELNAEAATAGWMHKPNETESKEKKKGLFKFWKTT